MRILLLALFTVQAAAAQSVPAIRAGVTRAIPLLQRSAGEFVAQRACVSCHHNALAILMLHSARSRGFEIDSKILETVETKTFRELRNPKALDDAIQGINVADPTPNDSYLLIAAQAAGVAPDLTTAVYARRMARWQRDGHWITSDFRPPHSSSLFTTTATAVRAIRFYVPGESAAERDDAIRRARQWLVETKPRSTEDAAFRLMGLTWAGLEPASREIAAATNDLLGMQKPDGGWAQLPAYQSDAYSSGEALFALREAGVAVASPALQKGLKFLLSSQARDGSWRVHSRMLSPAEVSPPYFSTGFPYGKDEFLSYAGSCWAVLALVSVLPAAPTPSIPAQAVADSAPPWIRTALFGTTRDVESLLNSGVDPNSKTANGTTMLMAAAHDPEKVRLLLARGADAKWRAMSGADALTVAATYYGSTGSIRLLLDAGAQAQPPESVRVRREPLVLASMSGDLDSAKLLLSRGAAPGAEALSEAVTFGHAPVVKALIDAGSDASIRESSGINLLHWATITNRSSVIPVLAAAHVPLDDVDDFGFTPLMYAATVDLGDTDTLKALLKAGADRRVRSPEGRTPLDQAKRLKHAQLVEALK